MFTKEASSTIFLIFEMTLPLIEPQSFGSLANALTIMPNTVLYAEKALQNNNVDTEDQQRETQSRFFILFYHPIQ